jgi:magnesium transporter
MITIHLCNAADRCMRTLPLEELLSRREELLGGKNVLWIDLVQPTEEEEQIILRQFFPIHTLSLEDVTRLRREPDAPPHFPKVEEFPDYLFVIVNPLLGDVRQQIAAAADRPTLTQLSAVITESLLITHHDAPLKCVEQVRGYLSRHGAHIDRGPDFIFHLILDHTVDEFVPLLDTIDETLDELEAIIMARPTQELFLRLLRLKRMIIILRKVLIAEREVLVRLARGEFDLVNERETVYYRNVYDHLVRFTELIESSREMVSDLMQTYLSSQSNHLNKIMKVLTMMSTIVLPMTLIAGIYGMNFERLVPDTKNEYGFEISLGMMLLSGLVSLAFFWWRRWL